MLKRIPALDGVRGVAVLWVMVFHFTYQAQARNLTLDLGYRVLRHGDRGVDLFFVLSGFLITGILLKAKERAKTDSQSLGPYLKTFYWRRTMRIFPLYYFALIVFLLGVGWTVTPTEQTRQLLSHQWMLWAYVSNIGLTFVSPTLFDAGPIRLLHFWSLAIEEQFYICWPLIVWVASRRTLVGLCLSAAIVSAAATYVLSTDDLAATPRFFTLCRVDALCAGAAMAALLPVVRTRIRWREVTVGVAVVGLGMLAVGVLGDVDRLLPGNQWNRFLIRSMLGYGAKTGMAAGLGVVAMNMVPRVDDLLSSRFLTFFGQYSYGLYVWHYTLVMPLAFKYLTPAVLSHRLTTPGALLASCVIGIGLSVPLALLSYHGFEAFFLRLKENRPEPHLTPEDTEAEARPVGTEEREHAGATGCHGLS